MSDMTDTGSNAAATRMPVIGVLVGSTRPVRLGRQLADQIAELARLRSEAEIVVIDLAEVALPWLDEPKMPARGDYEHAHTRALSLIHI